MVNKAMEQRFYCCSSSWSHHEAFNNDQLLIPYSKFKTTLRTGFSRIHCWCLIEMNVTFIKSLKCIRQNLNTNKKQEQAKKTKKTRTTQKIKCRNKEKLRLHRYMQRQNKLLKIVDNVVFLTLHKVTQ